jgi:pimeloyl-ACP methyl ester carboxylesterase
MVSASAYRLLLGSRLPRRYGLNPSQLTEEQKARPIVLFAHGAGDTPWAWRRHAKHLQHQGLALFTLPSHSEREYMRALDGVLTRCREQGMRGEISLILVGHSLGAIRHYQLLLEGVPGARVEHLFSIAGRSRVNTRWLRPLFSRLVPILDRIDEAFLKRPHLLNLVTSVVAGHDWLLPASAAERGDVLSLSGESHLSVKDAPETLYTLSQACQRLTTRVRAA